MFLGLLLLVSYKKYTEIGMLVQSHFRSTQKTYKTLLTSCHFIPLWAGQVDELGKKCKHPQTLNVTIFHFDQQMIWLFSKMAARLDAAAQRSSSAKNPTLPPLTHLI